MLYYTVILDRASEIYRKLSHAAMRAGRNPGDVRLLAVTKTIGSAMLQEAVDAGLRTFGENRVQEARGKIAELSSVFPDARIEWHLIGHLQRNKAKAAVQLFDLIHTVDSLLLAVEVNRHAGNAGKRQDVLIQVKFAGEQAKTGVSEKEMPSLAEAVMELNHLNLRGLMTMPPYFDDPEGSRPFYRRLRELRDRLVHSGISLPELSMGMSHDFTVAIEEGSTIIRVGTAIFGSRCNAG